MLGKNEILIIGILLLAAFYLYTSRSKAVDIHADGYVGEFVLPASSNQLDITRGDFTLSLQKLRDVRAESYLISTAYQYAKKMPYDRPADLFVKGYHAWPVQDERTAEMLQGSGQVKKFSSMSEANRYAQAVKQASARGFNFTILPATTEVFEAAQAVQKDDVVEVSGTMYRQVKEVNNTDSLRPSHCQVNTHVLYATRLSVK